MEIRIGITPESYDGTLNHHTEGLLLEQVLETLSSCGVDTDKISLYVNDSTDGELDIDG